MLLLDNPIQRYDWGTTDGIAHLLGTAATGGPEAELWVGTHPRGPSVVASGEHRGCTLSAVVAADPARWLGADLAATGATELPFLLKVLAIGSPLSLQAHPSAAQAAAGFAREEREGIPLDAPHRLYRDASAKPEALVALTATRALCGFRPATEAAALIRSTGAPELAALAHPLDGPDEAAGLRAALVWLLHLEGPARLEVAAAAARAAHERAHVEPWATVAHLAGRHPGDPGCLAPLLLAVLDLAPGEAVHLPAGNLHAYLGGAGVEVMASSDNVLRGGLTSKHIDVDELVGILRFEPGVPAAPQARSVQGFTVYDAGEEAFALARTDPSAAGATMMVPAPLLVLPVGGAAQVRRGGEVLVLAAGQAGFVEPGAPVTIHADVPAFVASTGAGLPMEGHGVGPAAG